MVLHAEARAAAKKDFAGGTSTAMASCSFKEFAYRAEDKDFWEMDKKGDYRVTRDEFIRFTLDRKRLPVVRPGSPPSHGKRGPRKSSPCSTRTTTACSPGMSSALSPRVCDSSGWTPTGIRS